MHSIYLSKLAIKIISIIILVVGIVCFIFVSHFNNITKKQLNNSLKVSIEKDIAFIKISFAKNIWEYEYKILETLSTGILSNKEISAINIYEKSKFISGLYKGNNSRIITLNKPYIDKNNSLKKVSEHLFYNGKDVGYFEIYYTEAFNNYLIEQSTKEIIYAFTALALIITLIIYVAIRILIITPIIRLSKATYLVAHGEDYKFDTNSKRNDEIALLNNSFNDMVEKIKTKDYQQKKLYNELENREKEYRLLFETLMASIRKSDFTPIEKSIFENKELLKSLNKILEVLSQLASDSSDQDWLKTGQTYLSNLISGEQQLLELCRRSITHISKYMNVQVGTIYAKEIENDAFYLVATYAYKERKEFTNSFKLGEGLIGQAALEKEQILFTNIPKDYIRIESSLGHIVPTSLLLIPLIYEGNVLGIIELGSINTFTTVQLEYASVVSKIVAVAIKSAISNQQLKALLNQTQKQSDALTLQQDELKNTNKELQESEGKLQQQQEELKASNEELEEQTQMLKESESKLKEQQTDLQSTNQELEEKTEMLGKQKDEIQQQNKGLEIKQLEVEEKAKQLELATKYKSEFLANMSHELRTPLNSMLLFAKMMADNEENNLSDDQIESSASIYRSGQNLLMLINDILDLSKIEAKKIELQIAPATLESIGSSFRIEFKYIAKEKNLDFHINYEEGLPGSIITDVHRLGQIIRNLLGNSFKFTSTGSVSLNFMKLPPETVLQRKELNQGNAIAIAVVDTGPGIPEEKQIIIFEAFKQVDGSISRQHGGTGLGLSISKELIRLLGGELTLTSLPNEGATFTAYIPIKFTETQLEDIDDIQKANTTIISPPEIAPEIEILSQNKQKDHEITQISSKIILIIEDDKVFADVISKFGEKQGYEPIIAPDGEMGIKYAIDLIPTAIILDIGLPGIDGWTVLAELKNNPKTRHIPVHIMSAMNDTNESFQKGAVGFLTKPITKKHLTGAFLKFETIINKKVKELLLIENDKILQKTILELMDGNDINTTPAGTGKKAIDLLETKQFDCIILDLTLPDISGFDLLDQIKSNSKIKQIPIIIYTGRDITKEESEHLAEYSTSIVIKNAASLDRLMDETALFMHQLESNMPEQQKAMLRKLKDKESVLSDKIAMIVDDDMRNAFALSKFLKNQGMETIIANNGQKALDLLEQEKKPDIILMDIMMPVMDGYTTMKKIREIEAFKNTPILALTAKAMESDREECIKCGANDYISKPVDIQKLLSMLRVWLY